MAIGYDALTRIVESDRVTVEPGDVVCLHTGFAETLLGMDRTPDVERLGRAALDGRDAKLLQGRPFRCERRGQSQDATGALRLRFNRARSRHA